MKSCVDCIARIGWTVNNFKYCDTKCSNIKKKKKPEKELMGALSLCNYDTGQLSIAE